MISSGDQPSGAASLDSETLFPSPAVRGALSSPYVFLSPVKLHCVDRRSRDDAIRPALMSNPHLLYNASNGAKPGATNSSLCLFLRILGVHVDLGCLLFPLAYVLLDGVLEVLLTDHGTGAIAFGLLLQVCAKAVQVEIADLCLGAVLYFFPVGLLVELHIKSKASCTYQTSLHLSTMSAVRSCSSASFAASI